ncbi:hypothetical protein L210DRAFT_2336727 [Boletus edulis BED1]|uniref:Uncharacterized protein n=1 Tax=Boletus edulis BED1 TaxID=1328754 RepID=A0AAD4BRB6_BOLED|nr:hypothetical protein L210DRAFT_2336727 [Boletus edulis BED1]
MMELDRPIRSTSVSQTERTRLHNLLVTGTAGLEEWLSTLSTPAKDYQLALERAGFMQGFDELFSKTLAEMGGLSEPLILDPVGTLQRGASGKRYNVVEECHLIHWVKGKQPIWNTLHNVQPTSVCQWLGTRCQMRDTSRILK